jgi:hypothetical protein
MIAGFPNAFELFHEEPSDTPKDCHRHCACWDTEGECCECEDKQIVSRPMNLQDVESGKEETSFESMALSYMDEMLKDEYLGG